MCHVTSFHSTPVAEAGKPYTGAGQMSFVIQVCSLCWSTMPFICRCCCNPLVYYFLRRTAICVQSFLMDQADDILLRLNNDLNAYGVTVSKVRTNDDVRECNDRAYSLALFR
jgi:hypothetical protein